MHSSSIHVLALNETKLDPHYPNELLAVPGYQHQRLDRNCNGGGVFLYIRDSLAYKLRNAVPSEDLELICVEIQPPKSKPYFLISWCRPPGDSLGTFDKVEKVLSYLDKEGQETILFGDTYCDLTIRDPKLPTDNSYKHICSLYELFSLRQLIEEPTRVTLNRSSILDHIATTSPGNIIETGVHKLFMSDHYMVFCVHKFEGALKKDSKIVQTRFMKNFDKDAILADVAGVCWEQGLDEPDDVDILVAHWASLFSSIINKHAPFKSIRVSERYCPWVSANLKKLMQSRDKIKKAAIKSKSPLLMSSYRHSRNKINKLNSELKSNTFLKEYLNLKVT